MASTVRMTVVDSASRHKSVTWPRGAHGGEGQRWVPKRDGAASVARDGADVLGDPRPRFRDAGLADDVEQRLP
jgi:hypothetical protein